MKKFTSFAIECFILFLVLPIVLSKTPVIANLSNLISVVLNVFLLIIFALIFGKRKGFSFILPFVAVSIAGISGCFLKYNILRIGFICAVYFVVTLVGEILGLMFRKKVN